MIVDVERGRTIKGWKPRRLGGGKGGRKSHLDNGREGRGLSAEDDKQRERDRDRDRDRDRERDRKRPSSRERSRSREKDRERKKRSKSKGKTFVVSFDIEQTKDLNELFRFVFLS